MHRSTLTGSALVALGALFVASWMGTAGADKKGGYVETDLVVGGPDANQATKTLKDANGITHTANFFDKNLVNSWGLVGTATGSPFWISDNGVGLSTLYSVNPSSSSPPQGQPSLTRVVSIPPPGDTSATFGSPTGVVFNTTSTSPAAQQEFKITGFLFTSSCSKTTATATFLFATEDGTIVGWNSNLYPTLVLCQAATTAGTNNNGIIQINNSAMGKGAVYKGLAIATDGTGATFLYVTNFRAGTVEKYDGGFNLVDTFTDPKLPRHYAPFNVVPIKLNGSMVPKLFVTFAVQNAARHDDVAGQGHGIVDTFDLTGNMLQRFAQHGQLDSPWGVALTPANFGELSGTLWIGNFGNGQINAYHPDSGKFISKVRDSKGKSIVIDGLWAITFGSGLLNGGSSNTLYFTAGPNGETDGLFGSLNPD